MNTQNDNHAPVSVGELNDRLMDIALAERVGGVSPPDLSARILAAREEMQIVPSEPKRVRDQRYPLRWFAAAVAATLLVGATTVLYVESKFDYQKTRGAISVARLGNHSVEKNESVAGYVEEFDQLAHDQRFAEAANVAQRLKEFAPNDPMAERLETNAKFLLRESSNRAGSDDKELSTWHQLSATEVEERSGRAAAPPASQFVELYGPPTPDSAAPTAKEGNQSVPAQAAASSVPTPPAEAPIDAPGFANAGGGEPVAVAQGPNRGGPAAPEAGRAETLNMSAGQYGHPATFGVNTTLQDGNRVWPTANGESADYQNMYLGQPVADAKQQQSSSGMTPQYAMAPRVQLGPASDGTLDRYAYSDRPANVAEKWTPLYAFTDPRLHKAGQPGEIALRPELAGPPPIKQLREKLNDRVPLRFGGWGDRYTPIVENPFVKAEGGDAVSTFGIDVDTASYSNVRQFLLEMHQLPPANAVRIEELVNYFHYDYAGPKADDAAPFAAHVEVGGCPWNAEHRLARIAVKGREMERDKRPQSNLVFLVDVSGSMNEPAKLPLVKYGLEQLTKELGENDHIAIVVYAGNTGVALPSTSGANQDVILAALQKLEAGGSTAGGAGIQLAYQIAEENFIKGGTNRVILCTDGDFNVGTTSTDELQKLVATKAKETGVFISTLGFGRGNLNDAMMVAISDHGNGNYHYIDNRTEARRVLVEEMTGTLVTIAKDVKIQVEFNPAKVAAYRLIGYEKRMLQTQDFNDDKKDAGEIGAGHTVTALYEIVPAGMKIEATPAVDELKYQKSAESSAAAQRQAVDAIHDIQRTLSADASSEMLTLKMRYKAPDGDTSQKLEWPVTDGGNTFGNSTEDFRFAAAVAGFGMLLRDSQFKGDLAFKDVMAVAENSLGHDEHGYRSEFLEMVKEAKRLKGE